MRALGFVVLCAAALAACDEDKDKFELTGDGSVPVTDSGVIIGSDGGPTNNGNRGPVVTLKNVAGTVDPLQGPVITGGSLEVLCEAKQRSGGTAVDISSVKVQLLDAVSKVIDEAPLASQGVDTFRGSVSLSKVPTGGLHVRCTAKDTTGGTALTNWSDVVTYYDGGPTITFENLDAMSIVPRGNDKVDGQPEFTIKFKVDPAPLAANDPSAAVTNVTLSVRDTIVEPVKDGNAYSYAVDFKPLVGTTPIEELKIVVTATNSRVPAAVASKQLVVKVDSKPPVITVMTPGDGTIVGGRVTAELTISDDLSGVSSDTKATFASLGDGPDKKMVSLVPVAGKVGSYTFDFEASSFPGKNNMTINITAVDNVGNSAIKSLLVKFDTVPPWVSLSSLLVRECSIGNKTCSAPFKALGESPQDGSTIFSNARFRLLVWERGIPVSGSTEVWISKVNDPTVAIYAQSDASKPLLIDTNKDGFCDTLDSDLAKGVVRHPLQPVSVGGSLPPAADLSSDPPAPSGYGALTGPDPAGKCLSEITYAISAAAPDRPTAVYAREAQQGSCGGISFSLDTPTPGWTCIVGAATDNSGNIGFSVPIRVCRKPTGSNVDCSGLPPASLTCTDGCMLPRDSLVNDYIGDRVFVY